MTFLKTNESTLGMPFRNVGAPRIGGLKWVQWFKGWPGSTWRDFWSNPFRSISQSEAGTTWRVSPWLWGGCAGESRQRQLPHRAGQVVFGEPRPRARRAAVRVRRLRRQPPHRAARLRPAHRRQGQPARRIRNRRRQRSVAGSFCFFRDEVRQMNESTGVYCYESRSLKGNGGEREHLLSTGNLPFKLLLWLLLSGRVLRWTRSAARSAAQAGANGHEGAERATSLQHDFADRVDQLAASGAVPATRRFVFMSRSVFFVCFIFCSECTTLSPPAIRWEWFRWFYSHRKTSRILKFTTQLWMFTFFLDFISIIALHFIS